MSVVNAYEHEILEPFLTMFKAIKTVYIALRSLADPTPGLCGLDDVLYVYPSNASAAQQNTDVVKVGGNVISALRAEKPQYWGQAVRDFKQTVGASEAASVEYQALMTRPTDVDAFVKKDLA